jgi:hypothetical protein
MVEAESSDYCAQPYALCSLNVSKLDGSTEPASSLGFHREANLDRAKMEKH